MKRDPRYRERARNQSLIWAQGRPYHEPVNDECCPDFSCCFPNLFTQDAEKRWQAHAAQYGAN